MNVILAGDVMLGRGVDQALEQSCSPEIREPYVTDAREYLTLAEARNGELDTPLAARELWGDALERIRLIDPDHLIVNLENAVTFSDSFYPEKGIHYRAHPENLEVLAAAGVDGAIVANNHVLDFDRRGLEDTLAALQVKGIVPIGAGKGVEDARRITVLSRRRGPENGNPGDESAGAVPADGRVAVGAVCFPDSGVPLLWDAGPSTPGVSLLHRPSAAVADEVSERFRYIPEEIPRILSVHWGANWGYEVPKEHREFARALLSGGEVDLLFGHSSHHPKAVERRDGAAAFYGAGDLINDYEGIRGHEGFNPDLGLLYSVQLSGRSIDRLEAFPYRRRRLRLESVGEEESRFLASVLSGEFGASVDLNSDGTLLI